MRVFRKRRRFGDQGSAGDGEPLPDIVYQMAAEQAARLAALHARAQSPYARMALEQGGDLYNEMYDPEAAVGKRRSSSPLNVIASIFGIDRFRSEKGLAPQGMNSFNRSGSPAQFNRSGSPAQFNRSGSPAYFNRSGSPAYFNRSGSPAYFNRSGSPAYFGQSSPGSPIHFGQPLQSSGIGRSRPSSPYQFQRVKRVPSPLHFAPAERMASPLHFAQQSSPGSPDVVRRMQRARLSQELQNFEQQHRLQQNMMNYSGIYGSQYSAPQQGFYSMMSPYGNGQSYSMMQHPQMFSYY